MLVVAYKNLLFFIVQLNMSKENKTLLMTKILCIDMMASISAFCYAFVCY